MHGQAKWIPTASLWDWQLLSLPLVDLIKFPIKFRSSWFCNGSWTPEQKKRLDKDNQADTQPQLFHVVVVASHFQAETTHVLGLLHEEECRSSNPSPELQTKVTELKCACFEALPSHWGPPACAAASLGFCGSYSEIGSTCRRIHWIPKVKLSSPFAEGYYRISTRKITSKQPCPSEREVWWTRAQEIFKLL